MRIYVASSWRNVVQPSVVAALRGDGHEVYDFRHPAPGNDGFAWRSIDGGWETWDGPGLVRALEHPIAAAGFALDMGALRWCDACVLVLPCGRSAHLELGWAAGAGKRAIVLIPEDHKPEPELMYLMCEVICVGVSAVRAALAEPVPCRGALGLWSLPADVRALVASRLDATGGGE